MKREHFIHSKRGWTELNTFSLFASLFYSFSLLFSHSPHSHSSQFSQYLHIHISATFFSLPLSCQSVTQNKIWTVSFFLFHSQPFFLTFKKHEHKKGSKWRSEKKTQILSCFFHSVRTLVLKEGTNIKVMTWNVPPLDNSLLVSDCVYDLLLFFLFFLSLAHSSFPFHSFFFSLPLFLLVPFSLSLLYNSLFRFRWILFLLSHFLFSPLTFYLSLSPFPHPEKGKEKCC